MKLKRKQIQKKIDKALTYAKNRKDIMFTYLLEMAKENGLNIHSYLNFLLKNRPSDNMSDEKLEKSTPWGAEAVLECNNKK